jgi:hypothetical protein
MQLTSRGIRNKARLGEFWISVWTLPFRSVETPSGLPKARRSSRSPVLFASIELGKTFRGFILNASEGGLCVQAAREIVADEPLELRFQSVQPGAWVEARGRIAWRNETRTVAGIEFVDLTLRSFKRSGNGFSSVHPYSSSGETGRPNSRQWNLRWPMEGCARLIEGTSRGATHRV